MVGNCVARKFSYYSLLVAQKSFQTSKCSIQRQLKVPALRFSSQASHPKQSSLLWLSITGLGAGAMIGGGYTIYTMQKTRTQISNDGVGSVSPVLQHFPDVKVSRRVFNANDTSGLQLTLFQYPTCPFCCKVRAFLNFHGITYDIVEVDPVLRQQMNWSEYKKVPIVLAKVENGYQQLNDSSMIISALSSYLQESTPDLSEIVKCYPSMSYNDDSGVLKNEVMNRYFVMFNEDVPKDKKKEMEDERKWRMWADKVLVHTLSPNVYRTREEALQSFEWFSEVGEWDRLFPSWERNLIVYAGAYAMLIIGKQLKKRHNLKDDVRQSLYDECNHWMRSILKKGTTFMGGNQPNLADMTVYGVLSSIEGCEAFSDLLKNTKIGTWYWPMKKLTQSNMGTVIS